jgi:hypothetical protein
MVLSFDSLRVVALYGCVMGSIHGVVIWLQEEAIVSPLSMHFFDLDVEEHIIHFT